MDSRFDHGSARKSLLLGMILAGGIIAAASIRAEPINVTAERSVSVGDLVHGNFSGPNSPYSAIGNFEDDVSAMLGGPHLTWTGAIVETSELAYANQSSTIDPGPGLFAGTGNVGLGYSVVDSDLVFARSLFHVSFDLTNDHSYTLTGTLASYMDGGRGAGLFKLDGPSSLVFEKTNWGSMALNSAGTLAAGHYDLLMSAQISPLCEPALCTSGSFMGGSSSFEINFQIAAVVPEPGTYALMLAGLGVLGLAARRRKVA
jgi:hypothetical protein